MGVCGVGWAAVGAGRGRGRMPKPMSFSAGWGWPWDAGAAVVAAPGTAAGRRSSDALVCTAPAHTLPDADDPHRPKKSQSVAFMI